MKYQIGQPVRRLSIEGYEKLEHDVLLLPPGARLPYPQQFKRSACPKPSMFKYFKDPYVLSRRSIYDLEILFYVVECFSAEDFWQPATLSHNTGLLSDIIEETHYDMYVLKSFHCVGLYTCKEIEISDAQ